MSYIFTAEQFIEQLQKAVQSKTLYVNGAFGAPAGYKNNRIRYSRNLADNSPRKRKIMSAPDNVFFFDCVCLIKGICWGWDANQNLQYGGATYRSNGVGDWAISTIASKCKNKSTDFTHILRGEFVYLRDYSHCGIYIGNNQVIECTPKWNDGVQISYIATSKSPANTEHTRTWFAHGEMPWIDYSAERGDAPLIVDGFWGVQTTYFSQIVLKSTVDGTISSQPKSNRKYLPNCEQSSWEFVDNATGSNLIRKIQQLTGADIDGFCGIDTVKHIQFYLNKQHYYFSEINGTMDSTTVKAWQTYINDKYIASLSA